MTLWFDDNVPGFCYKSALAQAPKAEAKYAKRGACLRPLEDVSVAIKDDHYVKGEIASGGRTVEVLGFAVNGYGTTQELLVLEDHVWKYAPDVVLLAFFTGNDVVNNNRELDGHPNRPYFVLREGSLVLDDSNLKKFGFAIRKYWKDMKVVAFNSLRSVQVARHAYKRTKTRIKYRDVGINEQLHAGLDPKLYVPPADRAWADAWSVTEEMIRAMRDKVRARGADFWIATLSTPVQVFPDAALRRRVSASLAVDDLLYPDRRIARLAEAEGIPAVILVERLRAYADAHGARLHGWGDFAGGHWNETGHRVAGQALAETLCTTYRQEN